MRILAIATNPDTGASTRFRILQWRPYLERAGHTLTLDTFFSRRGAAVLYRPGHGAAKAAFFLAGAVRRLLALLRAANTADVLWIHREPFPLGQRTFFRLLAGFPGPIVYDYDDAMFLPQRQGRGILARLEDLETPKEVMALSSVVMAGNQFLAHYARPYARRVMVFPTCIDTDRFRPRTRRPQSETCQVGWIGSHSTVKYLENLVPVLERVSRKHSFELTVVGSPNPFRVEGLTVRQSPWSLDQEIVDFSRPDVGVYPLWNDPWSQGKCGFKAIQFMACGVPVVASAVGVNTEIVQDGVNGFLAASEEEWVEKLGLLVSDPGLREKFRIAGRQTVEERYSLTANAPRLLSVLDEVGRAAART